MFAKIAKWWDRFLIKSYGIDPDEFYKDAATLRNRHPDGARGAVRDLWEGIADKRKDVPGVVKTLSPGDLANNTDWMFIQDVGDYIVPSGNDHLHVVCLYQIVSFSPSILIAEIECTNSIYSEWIVACSDSMWKTQNKVLYDIHGNQYSVGQMTSTACSIKYVRDKF